MSHELNWDVVCVSSLDPLCVCVVVVFTLHWCWQILQNKCAHFCLQLDKRAHVGMTEFRQINWLPVKYWFIRHTVLPPHPFPVCSKQGGGAEIFLKNRWGGLAISKFLGGETKKGGVDFFKGPEGFLKVIFNSWSNITSDEKM